MISKKFYHSRYKLYTIGHGGYISIVRANSIQSAYNKMLTIGFKGPIAWIKKQ